jgi:hypothetical protein
MRTAGTFWSTMIWVSRVMVGIMSLQYGLMVLASCRQA